MDSGGHFSSNELPFSPAWTKRRSPFESDSPIVPPTASSSQDTWRGGVIDECKSHGIALLRWNDEDITNPKTLHSQKIHNLSIMGLHKKLVSDYSLHCSFPVTQLIYLFLSLFFLSCFNPPYRFSYFP